MTGKGSQVRAEHLGPERRRPQVLDTALEIAAEHGVAQITMGAVSARLGVSRPVVYACYPGRGELLSALLERETAASLSRLQSILPPRRTGSVEQMFVDGFRSLFSDVQGRPASWRIIFADDPDPILAATIATGRADISTQTSQVMRPLFERWQVADIDRTLPVLTSVFIGICETGIRMMLDSESSWQPGALAEILGPAAYRALRSPGGPAISQPS
ncbi:putative TetR family transcriptional regulator [Gordonia araii NBRC 100433]|uniref:Putative TetR family transcriptional regulator n=1 Tax=Gordonia araii NBRC 100433 TaxID=1073574 RepID=G7GYZ3_9ACTN|nr:TetR/AcrR family transcriptional regulator [Gordonia araii]NNG97027.1 TetR/AcrR family transcriptional regulator [Gordonia araii NBRC 100433]GAB08818.1 putative TetR family transcriptional regulator [Gordonia araii NBRC 100433]